MFADPIAFRYLEEDTSTIVVERRGRLRGYEVYLVEQWATSRVDPTFVITTYTGDPNHSVLVGVLGIPLNEEEWSDRLRVYLKAISQYHARPKETPLGVLMVTDLSSFPSTLTVLPVSDGDIRAHRDDFFVNENLKRLGCSGRSGMSLATPVAATQAKFHQLYRTSERISLYGAVIELVKLCQVALLVFGKLEPEYADGCLCDITEKAINDWWAEIGSEYHNVEPTDGVLGPMTVAALLGLLMGARNRLNYYGAPVAKDPFDIQSLKRGIAYFQKSQKIERTKYLDRTTMHRLHQVTAKAAAGEGWAVPRAVKSTVAELSGKGGEMVMGIVGRDKAGISDIETLDIERFVELVQGERSKWLWHGKARRSGGAETGNGDVETPAMSLKIDEQGGFVWCAEDRTETLPVDDEFDDRKQESLVQIYGNGAPGSAVSVADYSNDRELRKAMFKSVTGKMSDARSGLERIKGAVGRRGHAGKPSRDETNELLDRQGGSGYHAPPNTSPAATPSPQSLNKTFSWKTKPEEYTQGYHRSQINALPLPASSKSGRRARSESPVDASKLSQASLGSHDDPRNAELDAEWVAQVKDIRQDLIDHDPSVNGSLVEECDLSGPVLEAERTKDNFQVLLRRRHSIEAEHGQRPRLHHPAWWTRHTSFSGAEEAVLGWSSISNSHIHTKETDNMAQLQKYNHLTEESKILFEKMAWLADEVGPWVRGYIEEIERLDEQAAQDHEHLQALYYEHMGNYQSMKHQSSELISEERSQLTDAVRDVEALGARLDYEINGLLSKVNDVEDGVSQFERHVENLEARYAVLEQQFNNEGWIHWLFRSVTGIGTAPSEPKRTKETNTEDN